MKTLSKEIESRNRKILRDRRKEGNVLTLTHLQHSYPANKNSGITLEGS